MSTQQQQTQQFNQAGLGTYNSLQGGIGNALNWLMGSSGYGANAPGSPLRSPMFQAGLGQGTTQANQMGQTAVGNITQNAAGFGGGQATPGFMQSQIRNAGYQTSGLKQNAYWSALQSAVGTQLGATGQAAGYQPLKTGQTQTTSGLGTWLPQLLGAGLGAASGGLLGGGGGGGGGLGNPFFGSSATFPGMSGMAGVTPGQLSGYGMGGMNAAAGGLSGGLLGSGLLGATNPYSGYGS